MASTVSHPIPTAQAQAIADLTGYEDAATLRWQQACVQAANSLTALPHGTFYATRFASPQGAFIPRKAEESVVVYRPKMPRRQISLSLSAQHMWLFELVHTA